MNRPDPSPRTAPSPGTTLPRETDPVEGLCPQCASALICSGDTVSCEVCGTTYCRRPPGTDRWTWTGQAWLPLALHYIQALIDADLGARAYCMVLAIAARTWGAPPDPLSATLGRRTDWVLCSLAELAEWTGQQRPNASRTLNELAARNIIWVRHEGPKTKTHRMRIRIAPVSTWSPQPPRAVPVPIRESPSYRIASGPGRSHETDSVSPPSCRLPSPPPSPPAVEDSTPGDLPRPGGSLDGRAGAGLDPRVEHFVAAYVARWQAQYKTDQRPRTTQQDRRRLRSCLAELDVAMDLAVLEAAFTLSGPYWQGHSLAKLVTSNGWNEALAVAGRLRRQRTWNARRSRGEVL